MSPFGESPCLRPGACDLRGTHTTPIRFRRSRMLDAYAEDRDDVQVGFTGFGVLERTTKEYSGCCASIRFHEAVPLGLMGPLARDVDYGRCVIDSISLSDYYACRTSSSSTVSPGFRFLASVFSEIRRTVGQRLLRERCEPDSPSAHAALGQLIKRRAGRITSDISALAGKLRPRA
jgi:hypothetical protein